MVTLEQILDKIADAMMLNINMFTDTPAETLQANQKTIRNGLIQIGIENENERLLLFQEDVKANEADLLATRNDPLEEGLTTFNALVGWINHTASDGGDITAITITISDSNTPFLPFIKLVYSGLDGSPFDISDLVYDETTGNPLNIGQFVGLSNVKSVIDPTKAEEYLDTTIYELLPQLLTRQQRIDDFFREFSELSGLPPAFNQDEYGDLSPPADYAEDHDISLAQDTPEIGIEEEDSFITRLNITANDRNFGKTLQSLRDSINTYLKDIDQKLEADIDDERPDYEEISNGYIKIRNLNQGIVVRKQEGDSIGLENVITSNLHINESHVCHSEIGGPSYLCDGFTVAMWVRFLDKTSRGTLFNYANPLRSYDPMGFRLETYVLNKDDLMETPTDFQDYDNEGIVRHTWGQAVEYYGLDLFVMESSERFVRLVVRDHLDELDGAGVVGKLYDSHTGVKGTLPNWEDGLARNHYFVPEFGIEESQSSNYGVGNELNLLAHTRVPIDFDEWFFIVANYNPAINDVVPEQSEYQVSVEYWNGNIDPATSPSNPTYQHYSGYGTKCKVEIISKTDLLRARGYKV